MVSLERRFEKLEQKVKQYLPLADTQRLRDAYDCAAKQHDGQLRKDGSPFVSHPLAVADLVADLGLDIESIMAALLHDCVEDTNITHEELVHMFGQTVADLVDGVTKLTRVQYRSKEEEQVENLRKMLMAMAKDIRVILIKICDRTHNIRTMEYQSERKQREKSLETLEIYAPIAHRLGMQRMKWELEDLSLKYLDPIAYQEIEEELTQQAQLKESFMSATQVAIQTRLAEEGIRGTVYGRIKHIYSIYRKMFVQNKKLSEIFDLYAFRVIVDDMPSCYNVLGVIHDLYRPVIGRFKDYIGTPKPNLYQSLHTTVIGSEGLPFEVQIRTWDMHHTAEYGIAAHWKYKQGLPTLEKKGGKDDPYQWVSQLLESQQNTEPEEYVRTLKVDLYADEVFVYTPQGDVINLPQGSTPIDYAYSIHSAVGNGMTAAKVNGRIVPFDYKLDSGELVEIITSKNATGPKRDWIKLAKSNEARAKIRQWFKKERREENIVHGRSMFEGELKHLAINITMVSSEEVLPNILKKLHFGNLDEMYAAIGYGGVSAQKCANRVREELIHLNRLQAEKTAETNSIYNPPTTVAIESGVVSTPNKKGASTSGVIVDGMSDCLTKFAKCCTPVPGDDIIGYITRGYGVSIHRQDCPNAISSQQNASEKDRWIRVLWDDDSQNSYKTALDITAKDRNGLTLDVATVLSSAKLSIISLAVNTHPDGYAKMSVIVQVKGSRELLSVMNKLNQIPDVYQVSRLSG